MLQSSFHSRHLWKTSRLYIMISAPEDNLLSKSFIVLFVILQVLFGLDFGFVKVAPSSLRCPLKLFCLFISANISWIAARMVFCGNPTALFVSVTSFLEYSCFTLALVTTKYNMYDFSKDIALIDTKMNVQRKEFDNTFLKTSVYMITSFLIRILTLMIYCYFSLKSVLCFIQTCDYPFIYSLPVFAHDVPHIVQYSIMYIIYRRFHILNVKLGTKELNEKTFLVKYKEMLDCICKIKPMFSRLLIIGLCINVPTLMYLVYMSLHSLKIDKDWVAFLMQYMIAIHSSFLICLPTIVAELINSETDNIKLILHNRLIDETDKEKMGDTKALLRYMSARPVECRVCRIIPVDLRLPFCLFSLCNTYLIVIIQFTHLYD